MELVIKERQDLRLLLFVENDQLCLSPNQTAAVFDHQCLWEVSIDILAFYAWS